MASKADALLEEYRAKRDFEKTKEPSGGAGEAGERLAFVVQKHDATRLHFDFRIELDGVLKSWAVTKGPSEDPADKRLAVRVEDHPLEYGSFEGTIPAKEYGGGTVMLWDEGHWEPIGDPHAALEGGDLKMRIFGERMKGEWVLVHMKGRDTQRKSGPARQNWLLIKHKDAFAKAGDGLTERFTTSISTGRDFEGIAKGLKPKKASATKAKEVWHSDPKKQEENPDLPPAKGNTRKAAAAKKGKGLALPRFRTPQLATLVGETPGGSDWLFEMKYDGYRCMAAVSGVDVRLYTRTGLDWTTQFGAMVAPLAGLTEGSALIDGEICAFDAKGRTDFSTLKAALQSGGPLVFLAFDLIERDGKDLAKLPLVERKAALKDLLGTVKSDQAIQYSDHVKGHGERVFAAMCRDGFEGVIAKRADAPYRGDRGRDWLKIKCIRRQEFVIGGWSPSSKSRGFASLLVGTWDDGVLTYRGRVGTGFNTDTMMDIQARLEKLARKTSPYAAVPKVIARTAHWVEPTLVAEIAFAEFTPDGVLRHPSFQGLREDKPAKDIVMEKPVATEAVAPKKTVAKKAVKAPEKKASGKSKAADLSDEHGVETAEVEGVRLTSPDRVVYPGQGVTKAELVAYYAAVAPRMLAYVGERPLSLLRCPQGRAKYCFFQKHDTGGFPAQMRTLEVAEKDGEKEDYFYIDDLAGLVAGAQMNVLEWHLWGSRRADIEKPERIIFDIDPDEGLGFEVVKDAAVHIRDNLKEIGLESFPLVSGGKGVHVIVPLEPHAEWPEVKAFCKALANTLAEREPERFTAQLSKARRKGKMFIDYLRNERGSTAIAPWSPRSREGAPVAVPVTWAELEDVTAANQFGLQEAADRALKVDPWTGYFALKQRLPDFG